MDVGGGHQDGIEPGRRTADPCEIPKIDEAFLRRVWSNARYQERAAKVMGLYLTDYTEGGAPGLCGERLRPREVTIPPPWRRSALLDETTHCLELWHGPTCAFKDMALQMLPHLLSASLVKTGEDKTVCILVATSGDTGKAAMEGFADVAQTKILVFYPKDGVSKVQETQMQTQDGGNVGCVRRGGQL